MRSLLSLVLLIPLLAVAGSAAVPGDHWWGVIVGASQYAHLDASLSLDGPRHDVPLVVDWLSRQHVPRSHVMVLADHVPGADGAPTRAAILAALAALPQRMHRGDIAFLYFAGHGSVQPQLASRLTKADGLEEVFLPADVGHWSAATGQVDGAIAGSDIGHTVDALRQQGVFVWLVFDSCHSATGARAAQLPGVRVRAVAPEFLSEPPAATAIRSPQRILRIDRPDLPGGYVAFYAAQSDGLAPELPLPAGARDRQVHGLFTYALLRSLGSVGVGSYREVAHRILAFYSMTYPATTPEFEGALDSPVGAPGLPLLPPGDWPAQNSGSDFHVEAGTLNGITAGAVLALEAAMPGRGAPRPIGLLRVTRAMLTEAWATPMRSPADLARWHVPRDLTADTGAGLVRPLEGRPDLMVRIAGPAGCYPGVIGCETKTAAGGDPAATEQARQLLLRPGVLPGAARLTHDASDADLLLVVARRSVSIVRTGLGAVDATRAVTVDLDAADAQARFTQALQRAVHAVALVRLAAEFPGNARGLSTAVRVRDVSGRWTALDNLRIDRVPLAAELAIRLQNAGPADLDVTVLAVDERFGVTTVYPVDQESNLLRRGSAAVDVPGWATVPGIFELLIITDEARPGHPHDVSYLAQPAVSRGIAQARQGGGGMQIIRFQVTETR